MAMPHRRVLETGANSEPLSTGSSDTYDSNASELDNKMVIILAVLLCSLILALGLNMVARCGLRYILRGNEPELRSTPGLKKRDLLQLPEGVYRSGSKISMIECSICLGEFVDGERVRVLPKCSHGFHVGCIDTWLKSHASCPNCRLSLHQQPPPCTTLIQQ